MESFTRSNLSFPPRSDAPRTNNSKANKADDLYRSPCYC